MIFLKTYLSVTEATILGTRIHCLAQRKFFLTKEAAMIDATKTDAFSVEENATWAPMM